MSSHWLRDIFFSRNLEFKSILLSQKLISWEMLKYFCILQKYYDGIYSLLLKTLCVHVRESLCVLNWAGYVCDCVYTYIFSIFIFICMCTHVCVSMGVHVCVSVCVCIQAVLHGFWGSNLNPHVSAVSISLPELSLQP